MSDPTDTQTEAGAGGPDWWRISRRKTAPEESGEEEFEGEATDADRLREVLLEAAEAVAAPKEPKKKLPRSKQDAYEWWAKLPRKTRFLLRHGSAVALGAWSYGLMEGDYSVGLPQTFGAWMQAAAASSTSPYTGLALGCFIVVGVALFGTLVMTKVGRWLTFSPVLFGALRYALAVPMSSAVFAVLIHTTAATVKGE